MKIDLTETSGFLTVGELRKFLDAHEKAWTKEDAEYLGEFSDQMFLSFPAVGGYTFSKMTVAYGNGGFFIFPTDQKGEVIH